ncbi:hypothetical protein T4A_6291 [Trichinella pseudospiralis]|uniref:Uncharacterized protein n=1 Tax=Trichinella pseudospiralis TaxID=6337 RepID=A0A0V1E3E9_TRIPS|nr:hypothetical protein T4A_6291 [Trichinella pseudospiralis]
MLSFWTTGCYCLLLIAACDIDLGPDTTLQHIISLHLKSSSNTPLQNAFLKYFTGAGQRTAIYNCNSLTTTTTTTTSSSRHIKAFIMKHYSAAAARNLPFRSRFIAFVVNVFDEFNCTSRLQFKSDILEMTNAEQGTPVPQENHFVARSNHNANAYRLSVKIQITIKRSTVSGEREHRQRYWNWNVDSNLTNVHFVDKLSGQPTTAGEY